MKNIKDMSEEEILALTTSDLDLMIRLKMAQEGIKIQDKPVLPNMFEVMPKNLSLTVVNIIGDNYGFVDFEEAKSVIDAIKKCKTIYRLDYDYGKSSSDHKYASTDLKRYGSDVFTTRVAEAYSMDKYNQVIDLIAQNKKFQDQYNKDIKEWESIYKEAEWIRDEIMGRYEEVQLKYSRLNNYVSKFKRDYLTITPENPEQALLFMTKAFNLTEEESKYIMDNYAEKE